MTYKFLDFDGLKHFYDTYIKKKVDNDGDISNTKSTFTQASSRTNLVSGETLKTSLGKIMKFFADLKTVAFSGSYNDLSNKPTSLPANGGDADTVGGKSAATLQAYANLTGKPTIVNNLTTTTTNTVLDGRQGKALNDKITTLNSTLTIKVYAADSETNGTECWAVVDNHTVTFCIRGTAAVNLGTSENYAFCGTFSQLLPLVTLNRSRIKRIEVTSAIKGQLRFDISTGQLRLGYTYNNSGAAVDIPKGTTFYLEETFVL